MNCLWLFAAFVGSGGNELQERTHAVLRSAIESAIPAVEIPEKEGLVFWVGLNDTPQSGSWCYCKRIGSHLLKCAFVLARVQAMLPAWLQHFSASNIFDGDNVFLAGQDRILARAAQAGKSWRK
jgi:hypothetical protein